MTTLREKITFVLTALAYLLFHLRLGANLTEIAVGTLSQMLLTAPYAIGFAYILAAVVRHLSGRGWPPWDRLFRLFFHLRHSLRLFLRPVRVRGPGVAAGRGGTGAAGC